MAADSLELSGTDRPERPGGISAFGRIAVVAIAGSILLMIAVSGAGPSPVVPNLPRTWPWPPWWLPIYPSSAVAEISIVVAVLLGALGVVCGLVALRRGARPGTRLLLGAGLAAMAVFTVLPPAGSTDALSYAAYGRIVVTGHSPYVMTPAQLRASDDPIGVQGTYKWQNAPSLYGPLATVAQWAAAELGGSSIGRVIFWLKVWFMLAFAAVAIALERLLRDDHVARARAHLLWSVNPLMLWAVLAGTHIDGLAAGIGFLGLVLLRRRRTAADVHAGAAPPASAANVVDDLGSRSWQRGAVRALAAGMLIGAAAAVKSPLLLFGAGLAWALRRSPAALTAGVAGIVIVALPGYLIAGPAAIGDLRQASNRADLDSFWRVFFGFGTVPPWLIPAAILAFGALAALLAARLPAGRLELPGIRPAMVVTLAWMLVWPLQRAWYDAIGFCLLAVFPMTRLDWLLLARSVPATLGLIAGAAVRHPPAQRAGQAVGHHISQVPIGGSWLNGLTGEVTRLIVPSTRLIAAVACVVLCVTGTWQMRERHTEPDVELRSWSRV